MKRDDFVCGCGAPPEPSKYTLIRQCERQTDWRIMSAYAAPDCDAHEVLVPVEP